MPDLTNCLHYVQEILMAGNFENSDVYECAESPCIIPVTYYERLSTVRSAYVIGQVPVAWKNELNKKPTKTTITGINLPR